MVSSDGYDSGGDAQSRTFKDEIRVLLGVKYWTLWASLVNFVTMQRPTSLLLRSILHPLYEVVSPCDVGQ